MGGLGNGNSAGSAGNTPATEIIFDRVCTLIEADDWDYPNDTVFIPADAPAFGEMMLKELGEEKPIVVVFADGRERLIPARSLVAP